MSRHFGVAGALALAVALAGCPRAGTPTGSQPSWRHSAPSADSTGPRILVLAPTTLGAKAYNDPPVGPAPHTALGDAVVAAVARAAARAGKPAPISDGRLFDAADQLAAIAPDDAPLAYGLIEFALQHAGIVEPSPHLLIIRAPLDEPAAISEKLDERLPEILASTDFNRVGVGSSARDGDDVIVLALQASFIRLAAVPRTLPAGGKTTLSGEVAAPFVQPEAFLTRDDGTVERVELAKRGARGFSAEIRCGDHHGKQQVEITAEDATGSTVLANFPVWCDAVPPERLSVEVSDDDATPPASGEEAEERMVRMVNRDRVRNGLPALAVDARLTRVARAHSSEMRDTGLIAHISPTTGSAADRVKAGGVRSAVVLENVARAYGVGEAEDGLMNSPGHRANLLSPEASHMGIGIVLGDEVAGRREMFVTQVFIRVTAKLDPARARDEVVATIRRARELDEDAKLSRIAQDFAAAMARGESTQTAAARSDDALRTLSGSYSKVTTLATTVADLAAFRPESNLADRSILRFGLGIAQGDHDVMGEGAIYIVLLLGQR
jgi:uncharacterized protein YkwD